MALNNALVAQTSDTVSSGYLMLTDTCVVELQNDSVFNKATEVQVEACSVDTAAKYVPLGFIGVLRSPCCITVTLKAGMYVRLKQRGSVTGTSINGNIIT